MRHSTSERLVILLSVPQLDMEFLEGWGYLIHLCIFKTSWHRGNPKSVIGNKRRNRKSWTQVSYSDLIPWPMVFPLFCDRSGERIGEVRMSKQIAETDPSPFLNILSFSDNGNY